VVWELRGGDLLCSAAGFLFFFVYQEPFFQVRAAGCGKAPNLAVGSDDAVAGDDKRQRIFGQCGGDGTGGGWAVDFPGQCGVAYGPAERDALAGGVNCAGECTEMVGAERKVGEGFDAIALEVGGYLLLEAFVEIFVVFAVFEVLQESGFEDVRLRQGQLAFNEGVSGGGQTEIAPRGFDNSVSYGFLHWVV